MKITKVLTPYNFTNKNQTGRIKYIVIHYFGGLSTAKNLASSWAARYVGASAHYAVGHGGDVYQCVEDGDIAWHCGAKAYKHPECRNANSIGIEMAVKKQSTATMNATDKDWYFEDATVASAEALVKELMTKYHIPADHVIRHYDVTGKVCPNPFVYNGTAHTWNHFQAAITGASMPIPPDATQNEDPAMGELSQWYRIRKSWEETASQIGAFENFDRAKAACVAGYTVFDPHGQAIFRLEDAGHPGMPATVPYKIIITASALCIRPQPNTKLPEVGVIRDDKQYTIVEEKDGWGRLKSGAGWISLKYTRKVS